MTRTSSAAGGLRFSIDVPSTVKPEPQDDGVAWTGETPEGFLSVTVRRRTLAYEITSAAKDPPIPRVKFTRNERIAGGWCAAWHMSDTGETRVHVQRRRGDDLLDCEASVVPRNGRVSLEHADSLAQICESVRFE